MSPRTSRRYFGSDDLPHLPPRKRSGSWLTPPTYSVNCAGTSSSIKEALADSSLVKDDPGTDTEPIRKKRKYIRLDRVDVEEEQVTRDLCTSFRNVESTEFDHVVPWRNTSNSPNGMDLQQCGTTSEEDLIIRDGNDNDSADTVRSAAELLTQLTCWRNGDSSNGQFPDGSHSHDPQGQDFEKPIRWGVKKKVSYESRRIVDSCDLGLCTGLIRKFSHDQEKAAAVTPAHTPDQNAFPSPVTSWDQSSPNFPASSEFNKDWRSSGDGGTSSRLQSPGMNFPEPGSERQKNILSTSRISPENLLKLPKEMQGRWSCERYKTAQLKLIDIMHARKAVPGKPILRPALREEARKHIGDTGLLDHLLKHMTDTIVSTGERFRRRHNSEGAMEYWLEHASLMELRKAAGVEDPSWIPPVGWKVGDKMPGGYWQSNRGMTSSEAAEMKNLKETVERLKSEMKVLCGSIKVSNQRGVLTSLSVSHQQRLEFVPASAEEQEDLIQGIRKDMIQFKIDMTSMEQQIHQERNSGANMDITYQNLDSAVLKMYEDRKSLEEISLLSSNQLDLESQLQDVSKTITVMQADVSHVINILGIVPPIKATPRRYQFDPGNPTPFMLSAGDETCSITHRSPESQPPGTLEPVLDDLVITKLDAPMRQCSNAIRSSNGDNMVVNSAPYTAGLSQALLNYSLVNQPGQLSAHSNEKQKPSESTMNTHDCVPHVTAHSRAQNFKPMVTSQPTGFRICRPPGSFVWPSMMNVTQVLPTKNPSMSRQEQTVKLRGLEDDYGNSSLEMPMSSPMAPVNYSTRSIAESKVAATMATMFGCMAMIPQSSTPVLPLMTNEVDTSVKDTARNDLGHSSSSPAQQSNPELSLSLSLSLSSGIPHGISPTLQKRKLL